MLRDGKEQAGTMRWSKAESKGGDKRERVEEKKG